MSEFLNKWFWIKNRDGILDPKERAFWSIRGINSLKCVGEDNDILILYYPNKTITIHCKKDCVEERPAPYFLTGDTVCITKKNITAVLKYSVWHFKGHYYFYHLVDQNGKLLKKRYMADELIKLEKSK